MEDKLFKGLLIIAAGIISTKAIRTVRQYRLQQKEHEEIIADSEEE